LTFLHQFHGNRVPVERDVVTLEHNNVSVLNVELDVSDVLDTQKVFGSDVLNNIIRALNFLFDFCLLDGWVGGGGFGANFAEVDFVLLADFLHDFVVKLLEHFFKNLNAADELAILIPPLDFSQNVVLAVGLGVVKGLFAGDDALLNQKLEAFFNGDFDVFGHEQGFRLVC
jgi:hypothetical protein